MERLQLSAGRAGGRTWLGEVRDDADGVGNALEARVRGGDAAVLLRHRWRRLLHHVVTVAAAAPDVLLLTHLTRANQLPARWLGESPPPPGLAPSILSCCGVSPSSS
jgi:hypothetical protein